MRLPIAVIATVTAVALTASTASTKTTLVGADGTTQALYQSWIDQALVPSADTRVVLHLARCPLSDVAVWCMNFRRGPVAIWTDTDLGYLWTDADGHSDRDRLVVKLTLLHEVGHVFDLSPGPKGYRHAFARIMRRPKDAWATFANNSLHEQFAQAYGLCAVYPHYADAAYAQTVWTGYDYTPTQEQYERTCYVIRNPDRWTTPPSSRSRTGPT